MNINQHTKLRSFDIKYVYASTLKMEILHIIGQITKHHDGYSVQEIKKSWSLKQFFLIIITFTTTEFCEKNVLAQGASNSQNLFYSISNITAKSQYQ
jgi:hypothetical protein